MTVQEGEEIRLLPTRDARLVPYALVALASLAGALVAGQPVLAALAVPFGAALVLGLRHRGPMAIRVRVVLDQEQVIEGTPVTGRIEVTWDGDFSAEVMLHGLEGVTSEEELAWSFPRTQASGPTRREELPLALEAAHWGLHGIGEVWVRLEAPHGLLSWSGKLRAPPALRVLPRSERLDRLLDLADSRSVWGMHLSRRIGQGSEFAELRPYVPGDRLRDLNWTATARQGRPFVNRHHPELSGEVVIVLDAFGDGSRISTETLAQAARAAWALASVHLRANDRVGLAGIGRSTQWLPPGGGRLARYRLLQTLLRIGGEAAAGRSVAPSLHRIRVPPAALILAISSLENMESLDALRGWRSRGRSVVVARIDAFDTLETLTPSEALALRLWRLELELRRRSLAQVGIPVVSVRAGEPMAGVVPALRRVRRAPIMRRGR
ncbi:MAG: DUF58 domain-containing protein [Gemmatimonadales bacterium]|nr:MAG: DUF58 domain-containing protein [Gemmatimonadales bacterium]